MTVDPLVKQTSAPYFYAGDDPVNASDPNGLDCGLFSFACAAYDTAAGGVKAGYGATAGALKEAAGFVYHHVGVVLEITAAGVCVVASAGVCAVAVAGAVGAELLQQWQDGTLNADNIAGTLLLGATDLLTAGIGGLVENIAAEATEGFTETVLYKGVSYTLRVLSVSPSVVIDVSSATVSGASTAVTC